MGAALQIAHVRQLPGPPKRKRKDGDGDGPRGPFLIIPKDACEACAQHWHHKCWGVDLQLPDEERPDCPCPCGDPTDPTGMRMSAAAWADLAKHCPGKVWQAVLMQQFRDGVGAVVCKGPERYREGNRV